MDIDAVGGVGIRLDDFLIMKLIEREYFTEEDWDADPFGCIDKVCVKDQIHYDVGGDSYTGDFRFYLVPSMIGEEKPHPRNIMFGIDEFVADLEYVFRPLVSFEELDERLIVFKDVFIC